MRVLVTGATGQVGTALIRDLQAFGYLVRTLGKRPISSTIEHHYWSLGMTPNPRAFIDVDCILHLAWITKDRDDQTMHLNVGGSSKIFQVAKLSGIKIINFSSFSAFKPISKYGRAKLNVENENPDGINLRIAKIERLENNGKKTGLINRALKHLVILSPRGIVIQVIEFEHLVSEVVKYIDSEITKGTYVLPHHEYNFKRYLFEYHEIRSLEIPSLFFNYVFSLCQVSRTKYGITLHDRWISLTSTKKP